MKFLKACIKQAENVLTVWATISMTVAIAVVMISAYKAGMFDKYFVHKK